MVNIYPCWWNTTIEIFTGILSCQSTLDLEELAHRELLVKSEILIFQRLSPFHNDLVAFSESECAEEDTVFQHNAVPSLV